MQPARLGQRPTSVNTQGPIRLRHACYVTVAGQRAAAASQPAGWYRPTACGRTDRPEVTCTAFVEKSRYLRNDDPYRHNTQHMSCTLSVRVCVPNFAVVRRGV